MSEQYYIDRYAKVTSLIAHADPDMVYLWNTTQHNKFGTTVVTVGAFMVKHEINADRVCVIDVSGDPCEQMMLSKDEKNDLVINMLYHSTITVIPYAEYIKRRSPQ